METMLIDWLHQLGTLEFWEALLEGFEGLGPLVPILLAMLESIFPPLPLIAIVALNIAAHGGFLGFVYSWLGVAAGGTVVFLFWRRVVKRFFWKLASRSEQLKKAQQWVSHVDTATLFMLAVLPFTPTSFLHLAFGISDFDEKRYLITMLLGGLWHGAAVRFILWGALHGVALALHKMWMAVVPWAKINGKDMNIVLRVVGIIFTFNLVCFGWLLFRAEDMQTVHVMLYQIFNNFNPAIIPQVVEGYKAVFALIVLGYAMHFLPEKIDIDIRNRVVNASFWWQVALMALTIWCVMQIKSSDIQPFIYFQF